MQPSRTEETSESLFQYASNFTINGGTFVSARRYTALQQPRRRKAVRLTGPAFLPIVRDETIFLVKQILCGDGYRIHAAHMQGRAVIVKVFSGRQAWKEWDESATSSRNFMHPNFVRIMGCSSRTSPDPYLVYHGEVEDSAERMLASVLQQELSRCLVLGLTMVYGIASALGYLTDKEYPLENAESMDFDIFVPGSGHVQICMKADAIHPSSSDDRTTNMEPDHTLNLFDDLCRRIFNNANRLIYCDEVKRSPVSHPDLPFLPPPLPSWLATTTTTYPADPRLGSAGRRELVWKTSDRSSNLNEIARQVEDFLFRVRAPSLGGHVQRYPAREQKWVHHRCPAYRREEIFLGTTAQSSVILLHSTPSSQEMCTVCGETVENGGRFRCSCGRQDDGWKTTTKCTTCRSWHHAQCACRLSTACGRVSYLCPISHCGKALSSAKLLRDHLTSNHSLKCLCGKAFWKERHFNLHLKQCTMGSFQFSPPCVLTLGETRRFRLSLLRAEENGRKI
ncbi:hypothetical protein FB451DRAFT_1561254, partial [Mycena latifolia]